MKKRLQDWWKKDFSEFIDVTDCARPCIDESECVSRSRATAIGGCTLNELVQIHPTSLGSGNNAKMQLTD